MDIAANSAKINQKMVKGDADETKRIILRNISYKISLSEIANNGKPETENQP